MRHAIRVLAAVLLTLGLAAGVRAQGAGNKNEEPVGEFAAFDVKVPRGNYLFAKGAVMLFGTKWGPAPQTSAELEDRIWEDLLLSYEAFRRNIKVEDSEVNSEITKMLKSEKSDFDWQKDTAAYVKWLKDKTGETPEIFANQLRYLMQLDKLRKQVMEGITPTVTEAEAMQVFRDEYNTLSVELAQFDKAQDAGNFYAKVRKNPALWDQEMKDNPKLFRKPGFVALEFLSDMWKFPKDDLYKMMKLDIKTIYPPIPIYSGKTGVCRIVQKRPAEDAQFAPLKDSYFKKVESKKKYDGMLAWVAQFKQDARIKVYKDVQIVSPSGTAQK